MTGQLMVAMVRGAEGKGLGEGPGTVLASGNRPGVRRCRALHYGRFLGHQQASTQMRPRRWRKTKAIQPGRIGSQNVARRNSNTEATAALSRTSVATGPATNAASFAPRPLGVGAAAATAEP